MHLEKHHNPFPITPTRPPALKKRKEKKTLPEREFIFSPLTHSLLFARSLTGKTLFTLPPPPLHHLHHHHHPHLLLHPPLLHP